jgi:hypothetical protein
MAWYLVKHRDDFHLSILIESFHNSLSFLRGVLIQCFEVGHERLLPDPYVYIFPSHSTLCSLYIYVVVK